MILAPGVLALSLVAATVAGPLVAEAQSGGRVYRVGLLTVARSSTPLPQWEALFQELRRLGYVEGQNLVIEWRYAGGGFERLPELAADLVRSRVDVIVVGGPGPVRAAKDATQTIPIVMAAGSSDPVAEGLARSLARPGGNITGLTYAVSPERFGKQLEVLKEAAGRVSRVAVLWDLDLDLFRRQWAAPLNEAARRLGLHILAPVQLQDPGQVDLAFVAMSRQRAEAVLVVMGGAAFPARARIAERAVHHRLPTIAAFREFPDAGGLMSYGPDLPAIWRRAASYVDRILKGAKPGDMPIELPATYELVINVKTMKALGLTTPPSLLSRADALIQ